MYLILVAIVVVPWIVDRYYSFHLEIKDARHRLEDAAKLTEEALSGRISKIDFALMGIAQHVARKPKATSQNFNTVITEWAKPLRKYGIESRISIFSSEGILVGSPSAPSAVGTDFSDRDWYREGKAETVDRLIISGPIESRVETGRWVAILSRRILDDKGRYLGSVNATIPLSYFGELHKKAGMGQYDLFSVGAGSPLRFVWREPMNDVTINKLMSAPSQDFLRSDKRRDTYLYRSTIDNIERLVAITKVAESNLTVSVGMTRDRVLLHWKKQTVIQLAFLATLILTGGALILIYIRLRARQEQQKMTLLQTSKLASLGEMSAGIAHEINNPLAIIDGALRSLRKHREDPVKFDERLASLTKSVERISRIVSGLKKFSRSSAGRIRQTTRLSAILNEVMTLSQPKALREVVPVTLEISTDSAVSCDPIEIEQVFINLVSNAIDAVKGCEAKWVKVKVVEESGDILVQVIDSGAGVPQEIEPKLFQPFFTTKPIGEGTGLGLSIVRGILEDHGAHIRLNRELDHTCFEVRFQQVIKQDQAA